MEQIIIPLVLGLFATFILIREIRLTIEEINKFFDNCRKLYNFAKLLFTYVKQWKAGKYKLVQGVFNTNTEKIEEARVIEAKKVDSEISSKHNNGLIKVAYYD